MLTWLAFAGVAVAAFLGWNLYTRFGADRIDALTDRRRADSRLVSRGQLVDGNRRLEVALALTQSAFFYENSDMQASIDLDWVREVEYSDELTTGLSVHDGKVLRLRCYSRTFEFVLPTEVVPRWHMMMPPRIASQIAAAQ
jgi:hypothetical protein